MQLPIARFPRWFGVFAAVAATWACSSDPEVTADAADTDVVADIETDEETLEDTVGADTVPDAEETQDLAGTDADVTQDLDQEADVPSADVAECEEAEDCVGKLAVTACSTSLRISGSPSRKCLAMAEYSSFRLTLNRIGSSVLMVTSRPESMNCLTGWSS